MLIRPSRRALLIAAPALIAMPSLGMTFPFKKLPHDKKKWAARREAQDVLVTLLVPLDNNSIQAILAHYDAHVIKAYKIIPNTYLFRTDDSDSEAFAIDLEQSGLASMVSPNTISTVKTTPNDPYYLGTTPAANNQWWLDSMNCPAAWAKLQIQGRSGVPIIVDVNTGCQAAHPDLTGNVNAGWDATSASSPATDSFGHGTECAGIMAALTNNSVGMASVGWGGTLFPIKASTGSTGSFTDANVLSAYEYALLNIPGPAVLNLSFGGVTGPSNAALPALWNAGYLIFAASGDSGAAFCTSGPCDSPYVVGVGACDHTFARDSYSNYGPAGGTPSAPGCILSAPVGEGNSGFIYYTTTIGSAYTGSFVGTSFSAPAACAVAAAIWSLRPDLKNWHIQSIMTNPANCTATTGFTTLAAPCIDYSKMIDAALAYVPPKYAASGMMGRR